MFGDSSQDVFSAVAFLRGKVATTTGYTTELVFVFGKARVASMKALTIPKLELQASLLAARLRKENENALTVRVDNIFMWTDSTTVLQWLHSLEKQPVFVTNRVAEILELTTADEWNYVKSSENPADAGTRGVSANSLRDSPWLKGPSFLRGPSFQESSEFVTALSATVIGIGTTFQWQKYSSYEKLLRVVAYILRLLPKTEGYRSDSGLITDPNEMRNAEMRLFYLIQQESFPVELKCLLKQSPVSNSSKLSQFSPFIGPQVLLRATGRTKQLTVSNFDAKHPILLDSRHPAVRLYLEQLHETHCHQGADYLRALVQQQFAIVKLRTALRSIVSKSVTCRKRPAETLNPMMSDHRRERLAFKERPFTNTGIEYFGPFYVAVKRSTEKRWASHQFCGLTTEPILLPVKRSCYKTCQRGINRFCLELWSKNGSTGSSILPVLPTTEVCGNELSEASNMSFTQSLETVA